MDNSNDPLDRLISQTLENIHNHALQDGLANSYHTLDSVGSKKNIATRKIERKRYRTNSLFAVAASIALIVGLAIPVLNSTLDSPSSDESKRLQTADKVATTTTTKTSTDPENKNDVSTTTNPVFEESNDVTTTTAKSSATPSTIPFFTPPSPSTTIRANVLQNARVSYSNTRANSIPLEGATITGNVYIFYDDPNIFSVTWWLDKPGVSDKNEAYSAGEKQPQDFNYRIDGITPRPYDTSQLTVGEHTMGIRTRTFSDQYTKYEIKFYVTR